LSDWELPRRELTDAVLSTISRLRTISFEGFLRAGSFAPGT